MTEFKNEENVCIWMLDGVLLGHLNDYIDTWLLKTHRLSHIYSSSDVGPSFIKITCSVCPGVI